MSCGLQDEAGDSAVRWNASADLAGWLVLHITFESTRPLNQAKRLARTHDRAARRCHTTAGVLGQGGTPSWSLTVRDV